VESQSNPKTDPVVLWMSGGPGCSGGLALLYENGPWTAAPNLTLIPNPYSWNKFATVIWIDQPAYTGYSYARSPYVRNEAQVAEEMRVFMQKFFHRYPQYRSQDFFVTGESYGGRYVPTVALMIAEENASPSSPDWIKINLQGIAIGNGVVDTIYQYPIQGQFVYENKLINSTGMQAIQPYEDKCLAAIQAKQWSVASDMCGEIIIQILNYAGDINPMNYKLHCPIALCFVYSDITNFFNDPSTKLSLGVPQTVFWQVCNFDVVFTDEDQWISFSWKVAKLLTGGIRVVAYYGDLDCVAPWNGGLSWTENMVWAGQAGFKSVPLKEWSVSGKPAGQAKTYQNLTFLRVYGGGHMVPHDVPENALQLFSNFLLNKPF